MDMTGVTNIADYFVICTAQSPTQLRAVADADNARKRAQAEAAAAQKYALERFAEGLLPVLDSLEAAVRSGDTSGVELTLKQLRAALEKLSG